MLVFDKQRKGCVAPPTADCDVPPPPPPEEGDENGFDGGDNGEQNEPRGGRPRARPANRRRFQQVCSLHVPFENTESITINTSYQNNGLFL